MQKIVSAFLALALLLIAAGSASAGPFGLFGRCGGRLHIFHRGERGAHQANSGCQTCGAQQPAVVNGMVSIQAPSVCAGGNCPMPRPAVMPPAK
jgi:hypothetical protein